MIYAITVLIQIIVCAVYLKIGYDKGYAKREEQFQDNSITFIRGVENSIRVENEGVKTKVYIYNKKLVDIIEL